MADVPRQLVPFTKGDPRINRKGQPRRRLITDLIIKELKKGKEEIEVEGPNVETGEMTRIKLKLPTLKGIVGTLLKSAHAGDLKATEMILDRVEGKVAQPIDGEFNIPIQFNFNLQPGNDPIK